MTFQRTWGDGVSSSDDFLRVIRELDNPLDTYLLEKGRLYPWHPLPAKIRQMEAKACWGNAYRLARDTGWDYVCGYACADADLPIPIMHAWVVDADGYVVDPTWAGMQSGQLADMDYTALTNRCYFGIKLALEQVAGYEGKETLFTVLEQHLRAQLPSRRRVVQTG